MSQAKHHRRDCQAQRGEVAPGHVPARNQDGRIAALCGPIGVVLDQPEGSHERAEAVTFAARATRLTKRSVYRLARRLEHHGDLGLARARPKNAGQPRVVLSRSADRLIADRDLLSKIAADRDEILGGLWKSTARHMGIRKVAALATSELRRRYNDLPSEVFIITRHVAERLRHLKIVDIRKHDRKLYSDTAPRIRRTAAKLRPMELVVVDVKHLDLLFRCPDGREAYPKLIAFQDLGTGRVFGCPVLLDEDEGIRREHVNEAFIAMSSHPRWGVCQRLLIDRGKENSALRKCLPGPLAELNRSGVQSVLQSRPYNPQSKPVEDWFGRFDAFGVSQIPGYIGPDRTRKKTETLGKPPTPYGGAFEEFRTLVVSLIETFNTWPVGGDRGDLSPEQILSGHVQKGWRPTSAPPLILDAAFREQDSRPIDRGSIKVGGERFTHPLIYSTAFTHVEVRLPWRRGDLPLFRLPGGDWFEAELDRSYDFLDPAGISEGDNRRRARDQTVRQLDKSVPDVDVLALVVNTRQSAVAVIPDDGGPRLDGGSELREIAEALATTPPVGAHTPDDTLVLAARDADAERKAMRAKELARIERLHGPISSGGRSHYVH